MLHPQVQALVEAIGADQDLTGPADLESQRAAYLQVAVERGGAEEPVGRIEDLVAPREDGSVPLRAYWPQAPAGGPAGAIVWLHGGGWCLGDLDAFDRVCRALCNQAGHVVVSVGYRLAPEHPFPAPVEDADAAVAWARSEQGAGQLGIDPARVAIGGDSAGGNLAAVAALHARDDDLPDPVLQLLVYPAVDPAMESDAYREFAQAPMLTAREMEQCWSRYLAGAPADHPDACPLQATLAGAAPACIAVAGIDPVRDDGRRYAAALQAAGVRAELLEFEDMTHGFLRWGGVVDRTHELLAWLGERTRAAVA